MADVSVALERRRGRPPITPGERSVSLSVAVPAAVYDALASDATAHGMEMAAYVRRLLTEFST